MTGPETPAPRGPTAHSRTPNLTSADPYAVLGLGRHASPLEIKRAYFELVCQYGPEKEPESFKLIRTAYEKLSSEQAKAETDLFLFHAPPAWEPRKRPHRLLLDFDAQDVWYLAESCGDLGRSDFQADQRPAKL